MFKRTKMGFSLAQSGEWPSDDDEDETFDPGDEIEEPKPPKRKKKREEKRVERREENERRDDECTDWEHLPRTVIFRLGKVLVEQTGNFLEVQRLLGKCLDVFVQ